MTPEVGQPAPIPEFPHVNDAVEVFNNFEMTDKNTMFAGDIRDFLRTYTGPKFDLILIDPPWQFTVPVVPMNRRVENHYMTMPLNDLMALPIQNITKKPSILFLWSINTLIPEACKLMEKWGFKYTTKMDWIKVRNGKIQMGLGVNVRGSSESLLIGKCGNYPVPLPKNRPASGIIAERFKHSEKPEESYKKVEEMYPDARKLELFARKQRRGWFVVGNQINGWRNFNGTEYTEGIGRFEVDE